MHQDNLLWQQLERFEFDTGFAERLTREQGWGVLFARQAIGEYRRFLFLTQVAGHAVTPSKAVDAVWHLHLLYTRSYWEGLCGEVLGRPLHHEPGAGNAGEAPHYAQQYERTLQSYRRIFGTEPPARVWETKTPRVSASPKKRVLGWLATGLGSVALAGGSGGDVALLLLGLGLLGTLLFAVARFGQRYRGQGDGSTTSDSGSSCGGFFAVTETVDSGASSTDSGSSCSSSCGSSCGGGGGD